MARTVTLQQIADKARVHADMRNSDYIDETEILGLINDNYCDLFDELVGAYENYFVVRTEFPITAGTQFYDLPADFYKIVAVDFKINQNAYISVTNYNEADRNLSLTTNLSIPDGTIRLWYVPAPTQFTSLSQTFDGVAGWDRLVSLMTAIDMLDSEESDTSAMTRKYAKTLQRVRDMAAPRDAGLPATVSDASKPNWQYIYGALRYRLYGNQISMINTEYLGQGEYPGGFG